MKPWLFLPSEVGHLLSPLFFRIYGALSSPKTYSWKSLQWKGLEFANPLGVAGGFDKNALLVKDLWPLGPGFVEVGTITPLPQKQNPGKTIGRHNKSQTLWNQLGFPNDGADIIKKRLLRLKHPHFTPIFVNIGKNRQTPIEKAQDDYIFLIQKFSEVADAFVINISSPNTSDLRSLFGPEKLPQFLTAIVQENKTASATTPPPILLKLSPDMSVEGLKKTLDISLKCEVDGWILTNTTLQRDPTSPFPQHGGISGAPLQELSKNFLLQTIQHLGPNRKGKLLVSVGGIMSPKDVFERLQMGADLVQVYSSLIFDGPFFFKKVFVESHNDYTK